MRVYSKLKALYKGSIDTVNEEKLLIISVGVEQHK